MRSIFAVLAAALLASQPSPAFAESPAAAPDPTTVAVGNAAPATAAPAPAPAPAPAEASQRDATPVPATPTTSGGTASPAPSADTGKPAPPRPPEITLAIDIDLSRQHMTVRERGVVVGAWPISSGREGYRTPTGTFRPLWQSRMWYSKKYDNAPMPHAVFFNGGVALHATQSTGMLGRPASHGCIRQSPANAARTYALVGKHGHARTRIVVHGTPRYSAPAVARRDRPGDTHYAARTAQERHVSQFPVAVRRVIFVDAYGNRRIGMLAANDPRLAAAGRRLSRGVSADGYGDW